MKIALHERDSKHRLKSKPYFTSFRLPLEVAQGIDARASEISKKLGKNVSFSEAIVQVLEQYVGETKAPRGIKSKLKASKHARDPYEKKPAKKAKTVKAKAKGAKKVKKVTAKKAAIKKANAQAAKPKVNAKPRKAAEPKEAPHETTETQAQTETAEQHAANSAGAF